MQRGRADHRILGNGPASFDAGLDCRPTVPTAVSPTLAASLDTLYDGFNHAESASDPVHRVRPYADPADREIAGFCAAALAFGRVGSVLNTIDTLFAIMGPHPAAFVRGFDPKAPPPELRAMVHRWIRGRDIAALLWVLRQMLERSGSIEAFFLEGDDPSAPDVSPALDSFSTRALALDLRRAYGRVPARAGVWRRSSASGR